MRIAMYGTLKSDETGPSRVMRGLSRALSEKGHKITLITHGDVAEVGWSDSHIWLGESPGSVYGFARYGREAAAASGGHDVVHALESHMPGADVMTVQWTFTTLELMLREGILPNGLEFLGDGLLNLLGWWNVHRTPRVIASSPETARQMNDYWHTAPDKIIPLGIDVDRAIANFSTSCPLEVLIVGRISEKKGQADLLEHLDPSDSGYDVTIAGSVPDDPPDEISRWEDSLEGFVDRDRLDELYERSDIVLVPSLHENFSMVGLEALATSNILFIRDTCGLAQFDSVKERAGAYVFQSAEEMASSVDWLASQSGGEISSLKRSAYDISLEYRWGDIAERYIEEYRSVLQ